MKNKVMRREKANHKYCKISGYYNVIVQFNVLIALNQDYFKLYKVFLFGGLVGFLVTLVGFLPAEMIFLRVR